MGSIWTALAKALRVDAPARAAENPASPAEEPQRED